MNVKQLAAVSAGLLSAGALAGVAEAQTIVTIGGSSAGTGFATEVPLSMLDQSPLPIRYVSTDGGRRQTWVGNFQGQPVVIRYRATGSADGVDKLLAPGLPGADPDPTMVFQSETGFAGCTGPTLETRATDGRQYEQYTGCTGTVVDTVDIGASDVAGSSFGQTGPTGVTSPVLDQSSLLSTQTAIVPFKFVLGRGVRMVDPDTNLLVDVPNLQKVQVEAILSRQVTDWGKLHVGQAGDASIVGDANGDGVADGTAPIVLCLRRAGSGTKATVDQVVMTLRSESTLAIANRVVFGASTQDVQACVNSFPLAIGYMDSDADPDGTPAANGYNVKYNGYFSSDPAYDGTTLGARLPLLTGLYDFWAGWRLNTRDPASSDPFEAQVIESFIATAGTPAIIALQPAGEFWAAPSEMLVQKTLDRGPISWK